MEHTDGERSIGDLLRSYTPSKPTTRRTERGDLLTYFSGQIERPVRYMAVRLAHYELSDLYALKSSFEDRERTHGAISARKYFWYITRTTQKSIAP